MNVNGLRQSVQSWILPTVFVLSMTLGISALSVSDRASAETGRRVALVIGNSAYVHAPSLRNPGHGAPKPS